jgi:hypothetical protein
MSKSKTSKTGGRVNNSNAKRSLPVPTVSLAPIVSPTLTQYSDGRTFHPEGPHRPLNALSKPAGRLKLKQGPQRQLSQSKASLTFSEPSNVLVCLRRWARKEVLHAKGIAGKSFKMKKRILRPSSSISCR